jgi:hypothetical protein
LPGGAVGIEHAARKAAAERELGVPSVVI